MLKHFQDLDNDSIECNLAGDIIQILNVNVVEGGGDGDDEIPTQNRWQMLKYPLARAAYMLTPHYHYLIASSHSESPAGAGAAAAAAV